MKVIRHIKPITDKVPRNQILHLTLKKKSVCFSGKKSKCDCVPFNQPFPNVPPDPIAI